MTRGGSLGGSFHATSFDVATTVEIPLGRIVTSGARHQSRKELRPDQVLRGASVKRGKKTAAAAARLFGVYPATVSRLLQRT